MYLRRRLKQRVLVKAKDGFVQKGMLKATTVHQELRVLRRMLNVAVRKKFLFANPCAGVEFPARVDGLFRPHYVTWSEQQKIEFSAPEYLRNVIRIVTETGLRIYKELTPMKKDQLDLENRTVWIPDSKTPNGVAEVPLTEIAADAFRHQLALSGPGPYLFPSDVTPDGYQKTFKTVWHATLRTGRCSILSHLRSPLHVRDPAQCRRRCGRVGHAVASARRCESVQEVLADEATDEAGSAGEIQPPGERKRAEFWHSASRFRTGFWHSFGTVEAMEIRKRWKGNQITLLESSNDLVGAGRFERPTPCAQGRCATRLRYAPTGVALFILKHFLTRRTPRRGQKLPKTGPTVAKP